MMMEEREPDAVEMGELARAEWERWFSEEVLFHHLVELCLDIQRHRKIPESLARWTGERSPAWRRRSNGTWRSGGGCGTGTCCSNRGTLQRA